MKHQPGLGFLITDLSGGGAERVVSNLARGLDDHRRELFVFRDRQAYPFDGEIHLLDLPLVGEGPLWRRLSPFATLRALLRLGRLKRATEVERCISFLTWPNLFNILTGAGEEVIISVRNHPTSSIRGPLSPVIRAMMRALYPRADHVVAISEGVRRDLVENFGVPPEKITRIYNPLRLDEIERRRHHPLPPTWETYMERRPAILTMGRLVPQKGQWHLLRAFAALKSMRPEARLILLGEGPLQATLLALSEDLGLRTGLWHPGSTHPWPDPPPDADVLFGGFLENPFPLMARARVFAFPSLWEGLGNVLIESLAVGLPVVAADCHAGPREILTGCPLPDGRGISAPDWTENGVLMPCCDGELRDAYEPLTSAEAHWAQVLDELLDDTDQRRAFVAAGPRRAQAFDLPVITQEWRRLLCRRDPPCPPR